MEDETDSDFILSLDRQFKGINIHLKHRELMLIIKALRLQQRHNKFLRQESLELEQEIDRYAQSLEDSFSK
ncbi:hypothetical protein [Psychrobacter sanguinis]|uniref:hypothetical protein n=1 Tax=Psychrobacter sanguinis TaxID=861445 RepID=UPI002A75476C|nr:hypothetical protein [Psychrobacter sanguinis]MDY3306650.1 hypothetical protein [Psychrobacter sanguinis]